MKKIVSILALLSVVLLVSCEKSHVCSCETTASIGGLITDFPVSDSTIENLSKKDAISTCNEGDKHYTDGNVTTTINCELK